MEEADIQPRRFQMTIHIPGIRTTGTFQDHIQSLKPWETSLLANIQYTDDPFTLTNQFDPQSPQLQMAQP